MNELVIGMRLIRDDWAPDKFVMILGRVDGTNVPVIRTYTLDPWLVYDRYDINQFYTSTSRLTKDSHIWLPHKGVIIHGGVTYMRDVDDPWYYKPI